jgi:Amt family ammonium transporter
LLRPDTLGRHFKRVAFLAHSFAQVSFNEKFEIILAMSSAVPLQVDSGDTSWMLISSCLVLFMTPGLSFFYGGAVNYKNQKNQIFLSLICMAIVGVQWALWGFSAAFENSSSSQLFSARWALFYDIKVLLRPHEFYSPSYPLLAFAAYQATFAIITPALISGAIVGRMKLFPYMIFIFLWSTFCYDPLANWIWSQTGYSITPCFMLSAHNLISFSILTPRFDCLMVWMAL